MYLPRPPHASSLQHPWLDAQSWNGVKFDTPAKYNQFLDEHENVFACKCLARPAGPLPASFAPFGSSPPNKGALLLCCCATP